MLKDKLNKNFKQFIGFGIVGIFNNLICLAVYYPIVFINAELYLLANVCGFLISTLNAYIMNSKFVFKTKKFNKRSLAKTYCTYLISLGISTFLLYIMVNRLGIDAKLAPIFCLFITVPFNFLLNRLWVYRT